MDRRLYTDVVLGFEAIAALVALAGLILSLRQLWRYYQLSKPQPPELPPCEEFAWKFLKDGKPRKK